MRRSRNSDIPLSENPVLIDQPTPRDLKIFEILYWHKFLPSSWIRWYFPSAVTSQDFITRLGRLREKQNGYLRWSAWPLNTKAELNRVGVYELALRGAKAIGRSVPPAVKDQDIPHDFIVSLHEASLRFQARDAGVPFHFLEAATYHLPSGMRWVPDGHPIIIGAPGDETLIHSEIERRKWKESPEDTEEKLDKAHEYLKRRLYKDDAHKGLCAFLCTTPGRKKALMSYTAERFGPTSFFLFATTQDWVREGSYPKPSEPLVPVWDRVGHPSLKLFNTEVHIEHSETA